MKALKMSKRDYDDFVYPAVAANQAKDIQELRVVCRILDKLEKHGKPSRKEGGRDAAFVATSPSIEIELEDAQAEIVSTRLEQLANRLQDWQSREILPLLDQLQEG